MIKHEYVGHPDPFSTRTSVYHWRSMEVGQSFFIPDYHNVNIRSQASNAGKKLGFTFSCRRSVEKGDSGIRVYRIA